MQMEAISIPEVREAARRAIEDTPRGASDEQALCDALELARPFLERMSELVLAKVPWWLRIPIATAFSALFALLDSWTADICADLGQPPAPEVPEKDIEEEPEAEEPAPVEEPEPAAAGDTATDEPPPREPPEEV